MRRFVETLLEKVALMDAEARSWELYQRTELNPPRRAPEWNADSQDTLPERIRQLTR